MISSSQISARKRLSAKQMASNSRVVGAYFCSRRLRQREANPMGRNILF